MRCTRLAATMVAAFSLSACGTLTSFVESFNASDSPAPVSSRSDEAATVGQVVYMEAARKPGEGTSPEPEKAGAPINTSGDQLLDVRMDNGDLRTVIQPTLGDIRLGDRVRLAEGRAHRL